MNQGMHVSYVRDQLTGASEEARRRLSPFIGSMIFSQALLKPRLAMKVTILGK
jgi:hypothetical protein